MEAGMGERLTVRMDGNRPGILYCNVAGAIGRVGSRQNRSGSTRKQNTARSPDPKSSTLPR